MGHWICHLSGLFPDVDGEGAADQRSLSMAAGFLIAKHDFGRVDLPVPEEVNSDCRNRKKREGVTKFEVSSGNLYLFGIHGRKTKREGPRYR